MKYLILLLSLGFAKYNSNQPTINETSEPHGPLRVEIYQAKWKAKYLVAKSVLDGPERFEYQFSSDGQELHAIFFDEEDCLSKLDKWPIDSVQGFREVNAFVRITFHDSTSVSLHFDERGGYYHRGQWHFRNNAMYHTIFQYFSDEMVPSMVLQMAKEGIDDVR